MTIVTIIDNSNKDNSAWWGDLTWPNKICDVVTFETLITIQTIENLNSWNLCYLTIDCDTGQHSQFLRCLTPSLGTYQRKKTTKQRRSEQQQRQPKQMNILWSSESEKIPVFTRWWRILMPRKCLECKATNWTESVWAFISLDPSVPAFLASSRNQLMRSPLSFLLALRHSSPCLRKTWARGPWLPTGESPVPVARVYRC